MTTGSVRVAGQGDPALLDHPTAQALLAAPVLARLAYLASDLTPRIVPMLFHWNGRSLVLVTFPDTHKATALRDHPQVAVVIDTPGPPPQVLHLRGKVQVGDVAGVAEEYVLAQQRYLGMEQASHLVAEMERSGTTMTRIELHPAWVGVINFVDRFPGGLDAAAFAARHKAP